MGMTSYLSAVADNTALVAPDEESLKRNLNCMIDCCADRGWR